MSATIVSLCPFPIHEYKPGLMPSLFHIEPAEAGDISTLIIGDNVISRFRVPVAGNVIDMPVLATTLAKAIIQDRLPGQLFASADAQPGLFYVEGSYTKEECKIKFKKEIDKADTIQKNWFVSLVKMADDDWSKTKQHRFISDVQRYAAVALGLTKEWNFTVKEAADKRCIACFSPIHAQATICPVCRTDQEDYRLAKIPKPSEIASQPPPVKAKV